MLITYAGQPGGSATQHQWAISLDDAAEDSQEIFKTYPRKSVSLVLRSPKDNQGQNATLEWHGLFFRWRSLPSGIARRVKNCRSSR